MAQQIAYDLCLLESYEEITGSAILLEKSQKVSTNKYFPDRKYDLPTTDLKDLCGFFTDYGNLINEIFELDKERICICGNSVFDDAKGCSVEVFDFYFDSYERSKIEEIISTYLSKPNKELIFKDEEEIHVKVGEYKINFHLQINRGKEQMFRNIKFPKIGWNLVSGYFCSVTTFLESMIKFTSGSTPSDYLRERQKINNDKFFIRKFVLIKEHNSIFNINSDVSYLISSCWIITEIFAAKKRMLTY